MGEAEANADSLTREEARKLEELGWDLRDTPRFPEGIPTEYVLPVASELEPLLVEYEEYE